jgi:hypothetical protein
LIAVSIDAVGCQNARSGLSPVATFVWMPCSYGSGMVTTSTAAPVARLKAATTFSGTLVLFCAAQTVSLTPWSFAVGSGQVTSVAVAVSAEGSLQAASATTPTVARMVRLLMAGVLLDEAEESCAVGGRGDGE